MIIILDIWSSKGEGDRRQFCKRKGLW